MHETSKKKYSKIVDKVLPIVNFPTIEDIKLITSGFPVFLSSCFNGMSEARQKVTECFEKYGYPVKGWETGESFGSSQKAPPREVYKNGLFGAKIYCGIIDKLYGSIIANGISATEDEYNYAYDHQLEMHLFISENEPKEEEVRLLVSKLMKRHTISFYKDLNSLVNSVESAIKNHSMKIMTNWIMIGDVITASRYKRLNNIISLELKTSNRKIYDYFESKNSGDAINFIDLEDGYLLPCTLEEINFDRYAPSLWKIEVKITRKIMPEREPWLNWEKIIDLAVVDGDLVIENGQLKQVSGRARIPQNLTMLLQVKKGEWLYEPNLGSYLPQIIQNYEDNPFLQQLLIRFEIIEVLTGSRENSMTKKIDYTFSCLQKIVVKEAIIKREVPEMINLILSVRLFIKGLIDPVDEILTLSFKSEEEAIKSSDLILK